MRRSLAVLLTIMLAFASFASVAHAMLRGAMDDHVVENAASSTTTQVAMSDEITASCCSGEVQHPGPSCLMLLAVLPAAAPTLHSVAGAAPSAMSHLVGDGLDPKQLLDPPRS